MRILGRKGEGGPMNWLARLFKGCFLLLLGGVWGRRKDPVGRFLLFFVANNRLEERERES